MYIHEETNHCFFPKFVIPIQTQNLIHG